MGQSSRWAEAARLTSWRPIADSARAFLQTSFDRLQRDMERIDALPDTEKRFIATMREFVPHIGDDLIRRAFEITLQRFPSREEPGQ